MVTVKEVLAEFPMSRANLYRLIKTKKIPAHVERQPWHDRQHYRFCLDEVRAAFEALKQERPPC
jgi:hypothetical protein